MLVKAKWNVKDSSGWHNAGDVFETENDLCDAVEAFEAQNKDEQKPESEPVKAEEPEKETAKPKAPSRRKASK